MKRKELSRLIASALVANITLNALPSNVKVVSATELSDVSLNDDSSDESAEYELNNNTTSVESVLEDSNSSSDLVSDEYSKSQFIYLSDLEYIEDLSNAASTIMKDANIEGKPITLLSGGIPVTYKKGLGAHANSTLVYDISSYSKTYTRFTAYLGLDYSKKGLGGNGVKFTISVSNDGTDWKVLKQTGALTATSDSVFVDLDISNYKYLKLYADTNGQASYDHSVYGDARIVTEGYNLYEDSVHNLTTVSEYDRFLRKYSIEENLANNENVILRRALVDRFGYNTLQALAESSEDYKEAIDFLVNNEVALKLFVTNGEITINGSSLSTIKSFCNIYSKYKEDLKDSSDNYFNLRMAISISLAYSKNELVRFWITSNKPIDAVTRYEKYQELVASGIMDTAGDTDTYGKWSTAQFKALPIPFMKWVVDNRINDDEIRWLADYTLSKKSGKDSSSYLDAYSYIHYTFGYNYNNSILYDQDNYETYNSKYNFSNYYSDYGTKNIYRLWMIFEEGSVCGGLAKTYANIAEVFGRPASVTGQPGHAASFVYGWNSKTNQYEWYLQNDIFGWEKSGNEYSDRMLNWGNQSWCTGYSASYLPLATDCIETTEAYNKFVKATIVNLLADSYEDLETKEELYRKALAIQSINLDAFEGLVEVYKADKSKTSAEFLDLAREIVDGYTYYPLVMSDLLNYLGSGITDSNDVVLLDLLRTNALNKAKVATSANVKQPGIAQQLANFLLGNVSVDLASFSFDGVNAGTIMINEKYKDSQIRVRYSLDGQQTWTQTDEHEIKLTEDELASINSANDIAVGLVGTDDVFVIDIKEGSKATNATLYKNDLENRFYGRTENLLISLDEGKTWCDYSPQMRFNGRQVVKVKYKAYGVYLESGLEQYTFTEDTDTETKKYVSIDHLTVTEYSSRTNESESGEKVISGSANDGWHSAANDKDKFITIKLDSVKYITAIDYMSSFNAGKIKNAEILTSLDGETWVTSGTIKDWQNNSNTKTVNLYEPTAARYVKIVATETHLGNSYFTCKMLNFYEDTTKTYKAEAKIEYTNIDDTVVAKLVLPSGCKVVGDSEHVFESNGKFEFKFTDANGEEQSIIAEVDSLDESLPEMKYEFDNPTLTNKDVTLSITSFSKENVQVVAIDENPSFDEEGNYVVKDESDESTSNEGIATMSDESSETESPFTYVFKENNTVVFVLEDKYGIRNYVPVTVNWIDKEAPEFEIRYDIAELTYGEVTAYLVGVKDGETVISEGGATHVFSSNGTHEFIVTDEAGNVTKKTAQVTWIRENSSDKDENLDQDFAIEDTRDFEVRFDKESLTNENVTATLVGLDPNDEVISEGGESHTFTTNGEFTFVIKDAYGNTFEKVVEVNWIDKEAPIANIVFDYSKSEEGKVIARLSDPSEEIIIINDGGLDYHEFTQNGIHTFKFVDKAGNEGSAVVNLDWFDFDNVTTTVEYNNVDESGNESVENSQADYVMASISIDETKVQILNNGGATEVKFVKNGEYKFRARIIDTGYEFDIIVKVDWLSETAEEGESPVEIPSIDDSTDEDNGSIDEGVVPPVDNEENGSDDESNNGSVDNTPVVPPVDGDGSNDNGSTDEENNGSTDGDESTDGSNDGSVDEDLDKPSTDDSVDEDDSTEQPPIKDEDDTSDDSSDSSDNDSNDSSDNETVTPPVTPPTTPDNGNTGNGGNGNTGSGGNGNGGTGSGDSGNGGNGNGGNSGNGGNGDDDYTSDDSNNYSDNVTDDSETTNDSTTNSSSNSVVNNGSTNVGRPSTNVSTAVVRPSTNGPGNVGSTSSTTIKPNDSQESDKLEESVNDSREPNSGTESEDTNNSNISDINTDKEESKVNPIIPIAVTGGGFSLLAVLAYIRRLFMK